MGAVEDRHVKAMRSLHPVFKMAVDRVLRNLESKGWQPVLVYGTRTKQQQADLHRQGVGAKRSWHVASREEILASPNGNSFETIRGSAADIIDRRWAWSGPTADKDHQFWTDLGRAARLAGLEWGGNWSIRDVAHVQMRFIEDRPSTTARV